jgi:hypothetical protein
MQRKEAGMLEGALEVRIPWLAARVGLVCWSELAGGALGGPSGAGVEMDGGAIGALTGALRAHPIVEKVALPRPWLRTTLEPKCLYFMH